MLLMNVLPLFAGIASLILAMAVLFSKRNQNKYPFVIFGVGMGVWAILITAFLLSSDSQVAELIARGYYIAAAVIFYGFLLFCLSFTSANTFGSLIRTALLLLIPLVFISWVVLLPDFISVRGIEVGSRVVELESYLYINYCIFIISHLAPSCVQLLWYLKHAKVSEQRKRQVRMIALIAFTCLPFGGLFNLVLPYFGNYNLIMLGPLAILPVVGITFHAMRAHGLFDMKDAAIRSLAYGLSTLSLVGVYYATTYLLSATLLQNEISRVMNMSPVYLLLAFLLALAFQPIKQFFDQVTDHVFYKSKYNTGEFLVRIGRILTSTTKLHEVLEEVGREIRHTLKASGSLFVVYRDHHPNEMVGEGVAMHFSAEEFSELNALSTGGELFLVRTLSKSIDPKAQRVCNMLSNKQIALVLPLISADEIIGYLMLGEHKVSTYTKQDIEALQAMANELVIAVQNARSVQVIRELNAHLEQRINEATKELRKSNEQLLQSDKAKDEFVSMASHQLRTPLTSIKGYISMVLEGDAGKITPLQHQLLSEAFTSSERMVHLIGDFLNVSRLQTGKFVLDQNLVNLADLVGEEVEGLKKTAEARSLKLTYRKPSRFPSLYIDDGKIHQVVMNFIDNAIFYSTENTTIAVKLSVEDGEAVFAVHDTGIGVPMDEQERLFTKFFRATNAKRQRPDGTGIGLFLAKKVITAHGGRMIFESKEGEGSTFGFRLPIKKLSEPPKIPEEMAQEAVEV